MLISFVILLMTILFSAFFSGMEIAFIASNRLRLEVDKKQGKFNASIISLFLKSPSVYITAMLIGNNLALVFYGRQFESILLPGLGAFDGYPMVQLLITTCVSTIVILFLAEFLPKALFQNIPNKALNFFSVPLFLFYSLLWLPSQVTIFLSNLLMRVIGIKLTHSAKSLTFGKVDLDNLIKNAPVADEGETDESNNLRIFQNAMEFSSIKVRECTLPRTEVVALEITDPVELLKHTFSESGYSKILIYKENIDDIVGYVHTSQVFDNPVAISDIVMPVSYVPESMPANTLLSRLIKEGKSIAVVVDEFGGTAGIVTVEDVLEEIFGEIEDEHDLPDLVERKISDTEFEFSARIEIDYLNEKYNLNIPESDDYETLAGYILFHNEDMPMQNEKVVVGRCILVVMEATPNRIEFVKLIISDEDKKGS